MLIRELPEHALRDEVSINPSVLFYSLCDDEAGGISATPYKWFYTVALPHALAYVAALNKLAGSNRYSIKANY